MKIVQTGPYASCVKMSWWDKLQQVWPFSVYQKWRRKRCHKSNPLVGLHGFVDKDGKYIPAPRRNVILDGVKN